MAAPQQEKPPVRLTICKSTTKDTQNIVSKIAGLRGSLDDLDEYAGRGNAGEPITRCGGRIFRTPVFRSKQDNSVPSEAQKSDGVMNQLAKENIEEQESRILKAITSWVEQKSVINRILFKWMGRESNVTQTLTKWLSTTPEWSVWISQHLFADLNLAVEEDVIDYNSIQVFFIGENLPAFVLVLYGVTALSESSSTEQDEETAALEFSVQLARDLTTELHKYCCVDFLLLPCALPYTTFIEDVQTLEKNIELEQKEAEWYYKGSKEIDTAGYKEVKEAASLVAGVSYVPYIIESREPKESEDKIWLLELNPKWRRALSLLTEALGSTENATYTLTCSEDKYMTVEMTVLEAARRSAISHDVILRVPTHSGLVLDKTKKDLLHLTGKRKHTAFRMHIETMDGSDVPALECVRYRGKSEAAHLQKRAVVQTSSKHLRRIFLSKEESKPPEGQTGHGQSITSKNNTEGMESRGHDDDDDGASAEQPQIILPSGRQELKQELRLEEGKAQNLEALKNAIKDLKAYSPEEYKKVTTLQGSPIYFNSPVFGCDTEDVKAEPPSNQLKKRYLTKKYEKHILDTVKKWAGKAKRWSVWISNHLYVDFNLTVGDIERDCLQVFFVGEDKPPWMLTLYDPGYSVSDDSRENMEKRMCCFSKQIAEVLEIQLRGCCSFDFTILPLTLSKQQWAESNLKQNVEKMQRGAVHLTTGMYQNIKAAATALTGVSYVPYILSKYKEEQTGEFSEQKHLTLMERDWRAALSLMIEALSFQEGDCHITYTSDNEYKVKVAALEAARRWSLILDVVFVADDFLNNGYVQGHTDLCYLSGDDDSERLQLSMQTPMEPHDSCAKYVFLDSDYLSAGAGPPSLSEIARKGESVASSVTSWGSKRRKHKSSTGSKSKSSVDGDFRDLADPVPVTQAEGPRLEPDTPQERAAATGSGARSQQHDDAGPWLSDSELRRIFLSKEESDHRRPIQASSSDFGSSLRVDSEVLQAGRRPVDVETAKRRGAHKEDKSDHSAIDVDAAFSGPMSLSSKVVNVLDFQRDGQKTAILQDASHVLAPKEDLVAIHSSSTKESEFSQSSIDAATLNTAFEQEGSSSSGFVYRSSRVRLSSPLSDITPTHSLAQSGESTHKEGELSHPEQTKTPSVKELSGGLTNRKETPIGEELSGELTKVEGTPTVEEQLTKYDEIQESVVNSVTVASPSSAANVVKGESSSSSKATTLSVQTELPTKAEASQTGGKPSKGSTALYTAASAGHLAVVKILLDRGGIDADVAHCGCGKTPLYAAAIGGHLDIVEMLLKYGADVNAETDEANGKETPLLAALRNKHSAVVKLLLEYGANTEVYTVRSQFRPLYGAAMNGDLDIMRLILERGADVNVQTVDGSTALNLAAQIGHAEMAMLLLEFKANLEIATFSLGVKPLLNAVQHGHIAVVDLLLKAGANVESMTKFGDTALHVAAKTGRASIAHLLLQNGADAEAAEPDCGIRPLHFAAKQGNVDVAKVLLQNGAQVDSESFDKTTPLFVASLSGHRHVVEVLLDHGASMDTSNREDGCKPLHAAARIGHLDVVQLYLQRGADIDSADKDGGTMLSFASFHGRTGVVKLLLDHGANTEGANKSLLEHDTNTEGASKFPPEDCTEGATVNRMGKRPLCLAAMNGHVDVARLLLEHGANTQSVNLSAENKPLSLAASNGYVNIVQLLLEHESIMGEEAPDVENVPLSLAVVNGHEDFVKLLLDYASRRKQQNT